MMDNNQKTNVWEGQLNNEIFVLTYKLISVKFSVKKMHRKLDIIIWFQFVLLGFLTNVSR